MQIVFDFIYPRICLNTIKVNPILFVLLKTQKYKS